MIKRVLIISFTIFIIGLILFWFLSGGVGKAIRTGKNFGNPIEYIFGNGTTTGTSISLPWQTGTVRGPDISDYVEEANRINRNSQEEDRAAIEAQYGQDVQNTRTFGNPSSRVGKIVISEHSATQDTAAHEYVVLTAKESNTEPIAISGWSLQSAVSGLRINIPPGTPLFVLGTIHSAQPIYLEPGASATITTGISPVGVSFRENICSGYLSESQTFDPELSQMCPSPSDELPLNAENLHTYGDACVDYVQTLEQCHFPATVPASLSPSCRSFLANTLSYNGCVNTHKSGPSFTLPSWRVFLGLKAEIWYNTHDVIRLLDDQGQIVDSLTY